VFEVICGDPLTNASAIKKSLILDWWKTDMMHP